MALAAGDNTGVMVEQPNNVETSGDCLNETDLWSVFAVRPPVLLCYSRSHAVSPCAASDSVMRTDRRISVQGSVYRAGFRGLGAPAM